MRRRKFILTTGTVAFSSSIFSGQQRPALGLEFELSSVPNVSSSKVESVLIGFSKFRIFPQYIDYSEPVSVDITIYVDDKSKEVSEQISILDGDPINREDLSSQFPMRIDDISNSSTSVKGEIVITASHKDIGSKEYKKEFYINNKSLVNGLKSYYPMEKGSGDILRDGVKSNIGRLKSVDWTDNSKIGSNCLSFDGSSYVSLPSYPNLSGSFSISAWIKTNDNSLQGQRVFADDENNTGGYALSVGDGGTGSVRFYVRNKDSESLDSKSSIENNTWYHIVAVHNSSQAERYLYINASKDNDIEDKDGEIEGDSGTASIGGETENGESNNRFNGLIDDLRIYDRVLTSSEIDSLYNLSNPTGQLIDESEVPNKRNGGVARYQFDGNIENSWGKNTPELNGDPIFTSGMYNNALLFDGTSDEVDTKSLGPYDNSEWTISAWFKTSSSGKQPIIGNYNGSFPQVKLIVDESGDGKVSLRLRDSTETDIQIYSDAKVNDDQWYHAIGQRKNGEGKVFVNGQFESKKDDGTEEIDLRSGNVHIGSRADGANRFVGKIDDVRLYNRSLDESEIEKLFNLGTYRV